MTDEGGEPWVPQEVAEMVRTVVPLGGLALAEAPSRQGAGEQGVQGTDWKDIQPGITELHPFQVYVVGMDSANEVPSVAVAWGTILKDARDVTTTATITDLNTSFTVAEDDMVWIEASITAATGALTAAAIKHGVPASNGWTSYPDPYASGKWFCLLAHIRVFLGGKEGGTRPDIGENPLGPDTDIIIQQLTNTHLVVAKECVGLSMERVWLLKPWHGAIV